VIWPCRAESPLRGTRAGTDQAFCIGDEALVRSRHPGAAEMSLVNLATSKSTRVRVPWANGGKGFAGCRRKSALLFPCWACWPRPGLAAAWLQFSRWSFTRAPPPLSWMPRRLVARRLQFGFSSPDHVRAFSFLGKSPWVPQKVHSEFREDRTSA